MSFEDEVKNFLKNLSEADEREPIALPGPGEVTQPTTGVPPEKALAEPGAQAAPPPTDELPPEELPTGRVRYIDTRRLFYTKPPMDSADWPNDLRKNPQWYPLQDRIVPYLTKLLGKDFKPESAGAARYSPWQFRILVSGIMNSKASIAVQSKKDAAKLVRLEVPSLHRGKSVYEVGEIENNVQKKIDLGAAITRPYKEPESAKIQKMAMKLRREEEYDFPQTDIPDVIVGKVIDKMKESGRQPSDDQLEKIIRKEMDDHIERVEAGRAEKEKEEKPEEKLKKKPKEKAEEHEFYEAAYSTAYKKGSSVNVGLSSVDAKQYAAWAIKNFKPEEESDLLKKMLQPENVEKWKKSRRKEEDIEYFFRKILSEAKTGTEAAAISGDIKEVIDSINGQIDELFIGDGKLIAGESGDLKTCLIKLGTCEDVEFAAERIFSYSGGQKGASVREWDRKEDLLIEGILKLDTNILVDARLIPGLGVRKRGHTAWEFRTLEAPDDPITNTFGVLTGRGKPTATAKEVAQKQAPTTPPTTPPAGGTV